MFKFIKKLFRKQDVNTDIANFIKSQPIIKLLNFPRNFNCVYCRKDYIATGSHHYIVPLCDTCMEDVRSGYITKEAIALELDKYNKERYPNY